MSKANRQEVDGSVALPGNIKLRHHNQTLVLGNNLLLTIMWVGRRLRKSKSFATISREILFYYIQPEKSEGLSQINPSLAKAVRRQVITGSHSATAD